MDETTYLALKAAWNKQDSFLIVGGVYYQVFTPDGIDKPIFAPKTEESLYGSLSMTTSDPKPLLNREALKKPPKPGLTKNPKVTDTGDN